MRHISVLVIGAVAVSAIVAFFVAQPLSAQDTDGELEEFRGKLAIYYADLAEAYQYVVAAGGPPEPFGSITEAQQVIPELTDEELAVLREAISEHPAWWDLPTIIRSSFGPEAQGLQATAQEAQGDSLSLLSHVCPAPAGVVAEFAAKGAVELAEDVALVADVVLEAVPNDTLNAGGRAAAAIVWGIPQGAVQVADAVVLGLEGANALSDDCEHAKHQELLHDVAAPTVIDIEDKVDMTVEMKRVHLQVIELEEDGEFLVGASEAGLPVDVEFIAVQVSDNDDDDPVSFLDVTGSTTVTVVKLGIHQVVIDLPEEVEDEAIVEFRVKHSHDALPGHLHGSFAHDHDPFDHFGVILFGGDD